MDVAARDDRQAAVAELLKSTYSPEQESVPGILVDPRTDSLILRASPAVLERLEKAVLQLDREVR